MKIEKFETEQFAGLRQIDMEFEDGLNVILGPNEAGKSTIIDGIHASLFKNVNLKMNNKKDIDFSYRFMPKPNGDSIDGKLVFSHKDDIYTIEKEWGANQSISLVTPDGIKLKNQNSIDEKLKEVLSFGESTYSNVVFAKQRKLKESISNIVEDDTLSKEITDVLRMALLELDGVSIDEIERNINSELDRLYKRWDIEKNYPENNRGVNNQYKQGLGEIIKTFYLKEEAFIKMENAKQAELDYEKVCENLQILEDLIEELNKEKKELEVIEEDINSQEILKLKVDALNKELKDLKDANMNWPLTENEIKIIDKRLEEIELEKDKLELDRLNISRIKRKKEIEDIIKKIEEIDKLLKEKEENLKKIKKVSKNDIDRLNKLSREIFRLDTIIKSGNLKVKVIKSKNNISYSTDLLNTKSIGIDEEIMSDGFIRLNYNDEFILDIKSQDINYEELFAEKIKNEEEYKNLLTELNISSINEANIAIENRNDINISIENLFNQRQNILSENNIDKLKEELLSYSNIDNNQTEEDIIKKLRELNNEELNLKSDLKLKKDKLNIWKDNYLDFDNLFNIIIDKKSNLNTITKELEKLKPLPERFDNAQDFKERLSFLKVEVEDKTERLNNLKQEYYEKKSLLYDETYEELNIEFENIEKKFKMLINRGEKLLKVKKAFLYTKDKMLDNPMEPLIESFNENIKIITDGKYKSGNIDEDFNISISKDGSIPMDLLSAGTYDSVSLALRFSLLTYIFKESGFLILDDCLVDLDPIRKEKSINLIKHFSKTYQIIFTTCDPKTAQMLGGNIINIK